MNTEEGSGEIIQRVPALRPLAYQRVGIEPNQRPLVVVILEALPVRPRLRPARIDDFVVGRVLQVTPLSTCLNLVIGRRQRELIERLLPGPEAGTGGKHLTPVLRLPFVNPQQAVLHRYVVIRGPEVRRAAEFAIPGMREFV